MDLPESMEELVYWTSRKIDNGNVKAWVYKEDCPECGKAKMGKPVDKGKVKIRATFYVCPACDHKVDKKEYEETLTVNIMYTCPHCSHKGDTQVPYKRKSFNGVQAIIFQCDGCNEKIGITKKMKKPKK